MTYYKVHAKYIANRIVGAITGHIARKNFDFLIN